MNGSQLIAKLREHQAAILANTNRAKALLIGAAAPDMTEMGRLRWEMVRLLSAYQFFKHREIFDVLIADGTSDEARIARRLKAECISLGEEVRQFVAQHSGGWVKETADEYRAGVLAFIDQIWEHMDYERRAATALLTHAPGTRAVIPPPAASPLRQDPLRRAG